MIDGDSATTDLGAHREEGTDRALENRGGVAVGHQRQQRPIGVEVAASDRVTEQPGHLGRGRLGKVVRGALGTDRRKRLAGVGKRLGHGHLGPGLEIADVDPALAGQDRMVVGGVHDPAAVDLDPVGLTNVGLGRDFDL